MNRLPNIFEDICCGPHGCNPETLEQAIVLAVEIAREGREGHKIGTLFSVSDAAEVMKRSRPMILDPLLGHLDEVKRLADPNMRETVKELAQLDGGFVITDEGVVRSACRYFDASSEGIDLPLGLGSRHMAGASMSHQTHAVVIVVSLGSVVRVFDDGEIFAEIVPELWMLWRHGLYLKDHGTPRVAEDIAVVSKRAGDRPG